MYCILINAYITDSNSKQNFTTIRFRFPLLLKQNIFYSLSIYFINTYGCHDNYEIYWI